jgi:DNA invertase Pin-like site-specific DNA recombinase
MYARVSTKDQNAARQYAANLRAAEGHGWAVTEYDDAGKSASRFARGQRQDHGRLVADVAAGQLDVVVLWEVSRGDRKTARWAGLLDACLQRGVLVHITSKNRTYDPRIWDDREALLRMGIAAEGESEILSERIRDGKHYWASQGHPVSGAAPYGIKRINDPDRPRNRWDHDEPHPITGPVAARIIRDVAGGHGYKAIGRQLDAEGIATPGKSASWDHRTIVKIAGHTGLAAVLVTAGLVTEAETLAARARIARTKHTGRGKAERPSAQVYRYSSCLVCATCGAQVRGTIKGGTSMYRGVCGHVSIPADQVDSWIDICAVERLTRPDLAALFAGGDYAAAEAARTEAARYRAKITEATEAYNDDTITLEQLKTITAANTIKIEAAEARAVEAETPSALTGLPDADRAIVAARWDSLTVSARKAALRALAPRAILKHGKRGAGRMPVEDRVVLWPDD